MSEPILIKGLHKYLTNQQLELLSLAKVGLAGLGGLGSNCALMLARTGVQHFVLIDYDQVDASNLNRQQFWPKDLGLPKTEALATKLLELNPTLDLDIHNLQLDATNLPEIVGLADIWVEALDLAWMKARLVETTLKQNSFTVSASGVAGFGQDLKRKRVGKNLVVIGDFVNDASDFPVLAPKVTWAAAMMCDTVITFILNGHKLP